MPFTEQMRINALVGSGEASKRLAAQRRGEHHIDLTAAAKRINDYYERDTDVTTEPAR